MRLAHIRSAPLPRFGGREHNSYIASWTQPDHLHVDMQFADKLPPPIYGRMT
jgi:hypothetical protein